jgi:hypothetical protein
MLEFLQIYVSGFWVWLGITIGIYVSGAMLVFIIQAFKMSVSKRKSTETKP